MIQRVVVPMVGGTTDEAVIAAALPTAQISLGAFEDAVEDHTWLAGDALSLADLHLAPVMAYFSGTPEGQRLLPSHPRADALVGSDVLAPEHGEDAAAAGLRRPDLAST